MSKGSTLNIVGGSASWHMDGVTQESVGRRFFSRNRNSRYNYEQRRLQLV